MITQRQEKLLNAIIQEYINSAEPISSNVLEKKYDFNVCPATIRNEMQRLTDNGYLFQPHTSAGRIPTDKGYRHFVDNLKIRDFEIGDLPQENPKDVIRFSYSLTKNLAEASQSLVLTYLKNEGIYLKEGWEDLLDAPEFQEKDFINSFTKLLDAFESHINNADISQGVQVCIGKENPFSKEKNFSIIYSQFSLPENEDAILAIFGPKRMAYEKNIGLINSLNKFLENF